MSSFLSGTFIQNVFAVMNIQIVTQMSSLRDTRKRVQVPVWSVCTVLNLAGLSGRQEIIWFTKEPLALVSVNANIAWK